MIALTGTELVEWVEKTSHGWKKHVTAHPEILAIPCDIRETKNVAELLQHIVAAELRYAERLNELPQSSYESIPFDSVEAIYAVHDRAIELLRPLLDKDQSFWEEAIDFKTRSAGTLHASRRVILVHALMHAVRHYAQLGTLARQHGAAIDSPMDYLMMGVMRPAA